MLGVVTILTTANSVLDASRVGAMVPNINGASEWHQDSKTENSAYQHYPYFELSWLA